MTIGIDASRANKDQKTGTEWYSWYIIEELKKIASDDDSFLLYTNEPLKGDLGKCPSNFKQVVLSWPPKYLWTQICLWWEPVIHPLDVLFVPAHTIPFLPLSKKIKVIGTVHDVGFKRFPEIYKPIQVRYHDMTMKKIKARADLIVTDSEFSKREIIELYNVPAEKIRVVYLGYDKEGFNSEIKNLPADEVLAKYKITKPYLLFVGRVEIKKNVLNMVRALNLAQEKFPELKLVLAGSSGNGFEELQGLIQELKLSDKVIITGYLSDHEVSVLTANANIFLFPTSYEGFGIPILQAMACGAPVLTSDMDIHREVAGEAAVFADPNSPQAISDKITLLLSDQNLRQDLIAKGFERVKRFSWKQTAEDVMKILK